jgi:hypothetical protein
LIDRRGHSNILDVQSFRGPDCGINYHLVVAKVRKRLAIIIQGAKYFDGGKMNLKQLNEREVRKQYRFEITNRFASFEIISDREDINRAWENIKENI